MRRVAGRAVTGGGHDPPEILRFGPDIRVKITQSRGKGAERRRTAQKNREDARKNNNDG